MGGGIAILGDRIFAEDCQIESAIAFDLAYQHATVPARRSSAALLHRRCSMTFAQSCKGLLNPSAQSKRRIIGFAVKKRIRGQNHLPLFRGDSGGMRHRAFNPGRRARQIGPCTAQMLAV